MPLLAPFDTVVDGRQSPRALKVRRGAARLMRDMGYAVVPELILASGRRADLVGVSPEGNVLIVEVKSSRADLLADAKWPSYKAFCDAFAFATLPEVADHMPADEGLIVSDGYDAQILRAPTGNRLGAPVRRAMHLRIAQTAARRLHERDDPSVSVVTPL